ncbi:putative glucose-6-phosphate 1-epimerase [Asterias rubens]|uniref:putative glucose-6-phosphate 1-epimerase n=1 Tax=Asterias rubens TaxID=7604 RepID=UPI001455176D|nr:putative glucose-6-phosphate 1-epimerase [Asterias rubens]
MSADRVVLERSTDTSLTVHLFGATVVSWKCNGSEILFVSKNSLFNNKKAIRGGIPVCFPQFGPWDLGPQHGFARITTWTMEQEPKTLSGGDVCAVFTLNDNEETRKMWNHGFKVTYTLTLKETEFVSDFVVNNTGEDPFSFTALLHTYLSVSDVTKTTVSGLKGLKYVDKVRDGQTFTEDRELVSLSENYDRVYMDTPSGHIVHNVTTGKTVIIKKTNLPDTVVWNPWEEKAKAMGDFGDDEYPKMLCVEAGHVSSPVTLDPGASFIAGQVIVAK